MLRRVFSIFGTKTFAHGIHPPESKDDTCGLPIRQFPFAPLLVVPLSQHIGKPAIALVREHQEVTRGQCIGKPDGFMSVAMHAPASGIVRRIAAAPNISGRMGPAIYIEPFAGSTQERCGAAACDPERATPAEIIAAIQQAGVVGSAVPGFRRTPSCKSPRGSPSTS